MSLLQSRLGRVRLALAGLLGGLVVLLVRSENPWTAGVARALEQGSSPRSVDYWASHGWAFGVADAVLLAVLILWANHWLGPREVPRVGRLTPREMPRVAGLTPRSSSRAVIGLVAAAMLVGGSLGATRLSFGLWDDEVYNVYRSIHGGWGLDRKSGEYKYRKVRWANTLWYYRIPNNHVFHSILARVASKIPEKRQDRLVNEVAVRMPAFLAGILSIGAIAWFLWRMGFPGAGVFAAWLLALNPWALRYIAEARGYSLAMLLVSLTFVAAISALHHGLWRRWLCFGLVQFLLLWNLPSILWIVVVLNLALPVSIWHFNAEPEPRRAFLTRWAAANLMGAMLWLPLMAPNVAQLFAYLARNAGNWVGPGWPARIASHLIAGMDWKHGGSPVYPELSAGFAAHPLLAGATFAVAALAVALGVARLWRAGGIARHLSWALWLPLLLTYLQLSLGHDRTYIWYFVIFLPGILALAGLGAAWLAESARTRPRWLAGVGVCLAFFAAYTWLGSPAREALRARPYYPTRDAVLLTRPNLDPLSPENQRILTASWAAGPVYYDPRIRYVLEPGLLQQVMDEADATGFPLYINLGVYGHAAERSPENLAIVEDPNRFEKVDVLPGFIPARTRYVYRYLGSEVVSGPTVSVPSP
ncbi:MAG: hypothetical protein GY946_14915 [bacterium]|nr:hypothetical protein [bacterium]